MAYDGAVTDRCTGRPLVLIGTAKTSPRTARRSAFPGKGRVCRLAAHDAKLKELRSEMRARGYLLIDRNDNPFCGHCSEVLFALENATA